MRALRWHLPFLATMTLAVPACSCDDVTLISRNTTGFPPEVDAGVPHQRVECGVGSVTGRVCAPDIHTWVPGADVTLEGLDCNDQAQHFALNADIEGRFRFDQVPAGAYQLLAVSGAFQVRHDVTVTSGQVTAIPDDQMCFAQNAARVAVLPGAGDKIEDLLTSLNIDHTVISGDPIDFLKDTAQLANYDIVFIDCAAGVSRNTLDLGTDTPAVVTALRGFVEGGKSVYASDWAFLFLKLAFPSDLNFDTQDGRAPSSPFDVHNLMGYAPQTVTGARVVDPALRAFLGKDTINVDYPRQSGVSSLHWGLMSRLVGRGRSLVSGTAVSCSAADRNCARGSTRNDLPLAVAVKVATTGQRGGNVIYTSFHNIAQQGDDVANVLKFVVFNL